MSLFHALKEVLIRAPRRNRLAGAALFFAAALLAINALWIPAKALLAQALLQNAWSQSIADSRPVKPWPWADTHPVAKLNARHLGIEQIVLSGDSGRVLAFGPGWTPSSAAPGQIGTSVISGHRDTHFSWLQQLRSGDSIELETDQGIRRYRVSATAVVDSRITSLDVTQETDQLLLVTCWPFDALASGGPERYVVSLVPESLSRRALAQR